MACTIAAALLQRYCSATPRKADIMGGKAATRCTSWRTLVAPVLARMWVIWLRTVDKQTPFWRAMSSADSPSHSP